MESRNRTLHAFYVPLTIVTIVAISIFAAAVVPDLSRTELEAAAPGASTVRVAFVTPLPPSTTPAGSQRDRRGRDSQEAIATGVAKARTDPSFAAFAELLEGARSATEASPFPHEGDAPPSKFELVTIDSAGKSGRDLATAIRKSKAQAIIGATDGDTTKALATAARSLRLPIVFVTPWEPRFSIDPRDGVTHLALGHVDHAIAAGNYAMIPLGAEKMAVAHDGTASSKALAEAFDRNRPIPVNSGGIHPVEATPESATTLLAKLRDARVDTLFVATGPRGATSLATAAAAMEEAEAASRKPGGTSSTAGAGRPRLPTLLFADGNASAALASTAPASSRFLEAASPWFEAEHRQACRAAIGVTVGTDTTVTPLHDRGYAALRLLDEALALGGHTKRIRESLRAVPNPHAAGSSLLTPWGAPRELVTYLAAPNRAGDLEGTIARINPLTLPDVGGGTLLRYRETSYYGMEEDSRRVLLTFGDEAERTIESDLKALGLSSGGYEAEVDGWVRDAILARAMGYLHKVFGRNADGTTIPGVSFDVTFATELPPDVEPHEVWTVTIAGDDPSAWGRAYPPNRAYAYASKLANGLYAKYALDPPLRTADNPYFRYRYRWNASLEENLRHDSIRALIDGFASAVAMTTAHELGHLAGCAHDRESPRSIMNVVDGGGISPLWAEWIPTHVQKLERALGRVKSERP